MWSAATPAVDIAFPHSGLPFAEVIFPEDGVSTAQALANTKLDDVPKDFVYDDTADDYTITWSYPGCIWERFVCLQADGELDLDNLQKCKLDPGTERDIPEEANSVLTYLLPPTRLPVGCPDVVALVNSTPKRTGKE